jgi:hypothetical protein
MWLAYMVTLLIPSKELDTWFTKLAEMPLSTNGLSRVVHPKANV